MYETLSDKEKQYRTLLENVNAGIYRNTVGEKRKFLQANPAIAKIFGFDNAEEFMKTSVSELYDNKEDEEIFNQVMEKDRFCKNLELKLRKKDRTRFIASCSAIIMYDAERNALWMELLKTLQKENKLKNKEQNLWKSYSA